MIELDEQRFDFISQALPEDELTVVSFQGREGLSRPYEFDVQLASEQADLDSREILKNRARLVIHRRDGDLVFHGYPLFFEQGREAHGLVFYRLVLAPLFRLLQYYQAQTVFLDLTVPDILEEVFKSGGLQPGDYELRLKESYPVRPYVCQYGETHFDFAHRLMERHGLYYFFEQGEDREKLILTDTALAHEQRPGLSGLTFARPSGLDASRREEIVYDFQCRVNRTPRNVKVGDYNYERPSLKPDGEADVLGRGQGQVYLYGRHVKSPEEGRISARIKAEELKAGARIFRGRSFIPFISAGFVYDLSDHDRSDFNARYQVIEVEHQGRHSGPLLSGLRTQAAEGETRPAYANQFRAIPADVQFRSAQKTPRFRAAGVVIAHVDAEGIGKHAELDEQGRYKIRPAFDLSGRPDGRASHWVRKAQPFGGQGGLHFPLHKGTEVMLTHIDGNPDRPLIASALPNPETQSPVSSDNETRSVMRSASHNRLEFDDAKGSQSISLTVPDNSSIMTMGQPHVDSELVFKAIWDKVKEVPGELASIMKSVWDANQGGKGWQPIKNNHDGFALSTNSSWGKYVGQDLKIRIGGNTLSLLLGSETSVVVGFKNSTVVGLRSEIVLGGRVAAEWPTKWQWSNVKSKTDEQQLEALQEKLDLAEAKNQVLDAKLQVATSTAEALNEKNRATADKMMLIDSKIGAINSATRAIETKIAAVDQPTRAINLTMELVESKVVDAEMQIDAANLKAAEVEAEVGKAGEKLEVVAGLHATSKELSVHSGEEVDL